MQENGKKNAENAFVLAMSLIIHIIHHLVAHNMVHKWQSSFVVIRIWRCRCPRSLSTVRFGARERLPLIATRVQWRRFL